MKNGRKFRIYYRYWIKNHWWDDYQHNIFAEIKENNELIKRCDPPVSRKTWTTYHEYRFLLD